MIRIPILLYDKIIDHAKREWPIECCGILSGKGDTIEKAYELRNEEESSIRYIMSPQEQLRVFDEMDKESMEMVAIYHSHPHTIPFPSETDVRLFFYPEVASIIISLKDEKDPVVKAFRIGQEAIYLEEINIVT
jgi:proteasome lid subunit RPN8/RPN11